MCTLFINNGLFIALLEGCHYQCKDPKSVQIGQVYFVFWEVFKVFLTRTAMFSFGKLDLLSAIVSFLGIEIQIFYL